MGIEAVSDVGRVRVSASNLPDTPADSGRIAASSRQVYSLTKFKNSTVFCIADDADEGDGLGSGGGCWGWSGEGNVWLSGRKGWLFWLGCMIGYWRCKCRFIDGGYACQIVGK